MLPKRQLLYTVMQAALFSLTFMTLQIQAAIFTLDQTRDAVSAIEVISAWDTDIRQHVCGDKGTGASMTAPGGMHTYGLDGY